VLNAMCYFFETRCKTVEDKNDSLVYPLCVDKVLFTVKPATRADLTDAWHTRVRQESRCRSNQNRKTTVFIMHTKSMHKDN